MGFFACRRIRRLRGGSQGTRPAGSAPSLDLAGPFPREALAFRVQTVTEALRWNYNSKGYYADMKWETNPETYRAPISDNFPKLIHFIWFGPSIPAKYVSNIQSFLDLNPGWRVVLWVDHPEGVAKELQTPQVKVLRWDDHASEFPAGLVDAVNGQSNLAGKADFLRLAVVYARGGIYTDTDSVALKPFDSYDSVFQRPFVTYDDVPNRYLNSCNGFFGFDKHSAFLRYTIDLALESCRRIDCQPPGGAGPNLLTEAMVNYHDDRIMMLDGTFFVGKGGGYGEFSGSVVHQSNDGSWTDPRKLQAIMDWVPTTTGP